MQTLVFDAVHCFTMLILWTNIMWTNCSANARLVIILLFVILAPAIAQPSQCSSCYSLDNITDTCQSDAAWKTVDECDMCGPKCREFYCGQQIGLLHRHCRLEVSDCLSDDNDTASLGTSAGSGSSDNDCSGGECSRDIAVSDAREDTVVFLAYPWSCSCGFPRNNLTALDIRIRFSDWEYFNFTVSNMDDDTMLCRSFTISPPSSPPVNPNSNTNTTDTADIADTADFDGGRWLRYDCPFFAKWEEGGVYRVRTCVHGKRALYIFRLPLYHTAAGRSEISWRPLIVHHAHRRDQLVYSIQRGPAQLCRQQRKVALVRCLSFQCNTSAVGSPEETHYTIVSSVVVLQFNCSDESVSSSRVVVRFDWPSQVGSYALLLYWSSGSHVLSTPVHYHIESGYTLFIYLASLLVPILATSYVLLRRVRRNHNQEEVKLTDVLILYNCRRRLVLDLSEYLHIHCRINCLIDIVNVPQASNQDPVEWLLTAVKQHTNILVLWMPESLKAPPPFYRLFHTALSQLTVSTTSKNVVVATAHCSSSELPHQLLPFKFLRLPGQLRQLVIALRGPVPGLRRSIHSTEALHLLRSIETVDEGPETEPEECAPLPQFTPTTLPQSDTPPLLLQPSSPPRRWPELLLQGVPSARMLAHHNPSQQHGLIHPTKKQRHLLNDVVWH